MSCWEKRTPFQVALILMLIVAIPTFIALTLVYVFSFTLWKNSERCDDLCCEMQSKRDENFYKFFEPDEDDGPDLVPFGERRAYVTIMRVKQDYRGVGIFLDDDWILHVSGSADNVDQISVDTTYDVKSSATPHNMSNCYGKDQEGPQRFVKVYKLGGRLKGPFVQDSYDMKDNFDDLFTFHWDGGTFKKIDVFKNQSVKDCEPVKGLKCYYLKSNPFPEKNCAKEVPMFFAPLLGKKDRLLGFSHSVHCLENKVWMNWAHIEKSQLECVKSYIKENNERKNETKIEKSGKQR